MEIMKGQEALDMGTTDKGARQLITGLEQRVNDVVESNIEVASNQVDAARLMEDLNARLTKLEYLNARVAKLEKMPKRVEDLELESSAGVGLGKINDRLTVLEKNVVKLCKAEERA